VRSEFCNNTAQPQNLVLHYAAYMNFPPLRTYSDDPLNPSRAILPPSALWLDALDYDDLSFATPRPQDNLVYDGMWRGEVRGYGFVNGTGLGTGFGRERGDRVQYTLPLTETKSDMVLLVRYRALEGAIAFHMEGLASGRLELPACSNFGIATLWQGNLPEGQSILSLVAAGGRIKWKK
jgi:hypothetical protein